MTHIHWRKEKRIERKLFGSDAPVQEAWNLGCHDAYEGNAYRNPFPKGKRHDEYNRGYRTVEDN